LKKQLLKPFNIALYGRKETMLQNQRAKEEMQREAKEEEQSVRSGNKIFSTSKLSIKHPSPKKR
jgi:hypothetical protein